MVRAAPVQAVSTVCGWTTPGSRVRLVVERERVAAQVHDLCETRDRLDRIIAAARASAPAGTAS